jgi:hypothetical protein
MGIVAAAGPVSNLLLAICFALVGKIVLSVLPDSFFTQWFAANIGHGIMLSLVIGIFYLLPILPLDGGRILLSLLPLKYAIRYQETEKYGFFILIGVMFYSASFPVTMELMDSKVADILGFIGMEKDFEAFSKFSVFSKNIINKTEYWIEIIKENIEKATTETKKIPSVLITCAAKFPCENGYITSNFGKREDPFSKEEAFHSGIDIAAEKGSEIKTAWPGKISKTGFDNIYGKYIIVEHSKEFFTKYCHLSKICIRENNFINAGEKIGEAGNTGRSTGSHLHFEVIIDGFNIDPMECFEI